jgi:hypothetical protein
VGRYRTLGSIRLAGAKNAYSKMPLWDKHAINLALQRVLEAQQARRGKKAVAGGERPKAVL